MKKILLLIVFVMFFILFINCRKNNEQKNFTDLVDEKTSYIASGMMESFYPNGRKQNDFEVLYKSKDLIKVTLSDSNVENDVSEKQIILKNKEGVYVLIPSINKNFKIQSDWPVGNSYPYLLYSLVLDIKDNKNSISTENEDSIIYETTTNVFRNDNGFKEKIILDKKTKLPEEVIIYDEDDNIFIRVVFSNIKLNADIKDKEYVVDETMSTLKEEYDNNFEYINRVIRYPIVYPEGMRLVNESVEKSDDGKELLCIMKYSNNEKSFTVIEEYMNMKDSMAYQQETGDLVNILGVVGIIKENSIIAIYNGVEYTVASNDLTIDEMIDVIGSLMYDDEK